MNNHEKCFRRDKKILQTIERLGTLDTDQVSALFFPGIKNKKRMAQKRLKRLYTLKKLKRGREAISMPYYYYTGIRPGMVEHTLGVAWVYVWITKRLKSWEKMQSFEKEYTLGNIRADAFMEIRNKVTGKTRFTFVEVDMAESMNKFDKVKKYNDFYRAGKYASAWWAEKADRFPNILVVTTEPDRLKLVRTKIERENISGLEFNTFLLGEIKEEVIGKC